MKPEAPAPEDVPAIRSALLAHYDRQARDLPWRRDRDPYRVLVSEVMLQQTRVETVLGYYEPWLERFPTVEALAEAGEDEVMKAWEGLGYYRRARNLHAAARVVREEPAGIPTTRDGLRELPGVGEYTAGAVASIAFREPVPAVDGNVRRVLARLYDEPDPKGAWLRDRAGGLVHPERPGDWNQALMELGATVCAPRGPDCGVCPLARWCAARAAGTQLERPAPARKREVPKARFVLAVLEREGEVLVRKRPTGGLLGGLWAFPEVRLAEEAMSGTMTLADSPGDGGAVDTIDIARGVADELGLHVGAARRLESVRHRFTHLDATYLPVVLTVEGPPPEVVTGEGAGDSGTGMSAPDLRWIDPDDDESTAVPTAQRKVLDAWRRGRTKRERS